MARLEFFIPGPPRAWKRAKPVRLGKTGHVQMKDPPEQVEYKKVIHHHFTRAVMRDKLHLLLDEPWTGVASISVIALFDCPKDYWEGKLPTNGNDCSNIQKLVEDALQAPHANKVNAENKRRKKARGFIAPEEKKIYAWKDDATIVNGMHAKRFYKRAGTIIEINWYKRVPKPYHSTLARTYCGAPEGEPRPRRRVR